MAKTEKGGATANVSAPFQAEDDARALTNAQEVRIDEKRHQGAIKHLKGKAGSVQAAIKMEEKVKKGLKAAFPCSCGKKNCKECSHAG